MERDRVSSIRDMWSRRNKWCWSTNDNHGPVSFDTSKKTLERVDGEKGLSIGGGIVWWS